jgi:hypothetical protein
MTWDEAMMTWAEASFTWATSFLGVNQVSRGLTWAQAGMTWGGTIASLYTWRDGWPDIAAALQPTIQQDFNLAATWPAYVPAEVAGFTDCGLKITLRRPHTRYVPRITALVGKGYTFTSTSGGSVPDFLLFMGRVI